MDGIAVGAFHHEVIGRLRQDRVAQERHVQPADIPGEPQARRLAVLLDIQADGCRAEDVARVEQAGGHPRDWAKRVIVLDPAQVPGDPGRVLDRVQRLDPLPAPALRMLVDELRRPLPGCDRNRAA